MFAFERDKDIAFILAPNESDIVLPIVISIYNFSFVVNSALAIIPQTMDAMIRVFTIQFKNLFEEKSFY